MTGWFYFIRIIGLCIRCLVPPHKNELKRFEDPWNWTSFGG